jgi:Kef-type K+ transport system membrane component KefB
MIGQPLLAVGLMLILGYLGGRTVNSLRLPRVSGYLLVGMLVSPSCLNVFSHSLIDEDLQIVTEMGLAVIAYSIGGSLVLERLKRIGSSIIWITFLQAGVSWVFTTGVLIPIMPFLTAFRPPIYELYNTHLPMALLIGAICVATASGAILAIINELKASGPFTVTLLGVIALSYGLTVILFTLAEALSQVLAKPSSVSWIEMLANTLKGIGLSVLLGVIAAVILLMIARLVRRREAMLMIVLGAILSTSGVAASLGLSSLLADMTIGFLAANLEPRRNDFFIVIEPIEEPLFGLFFGMAGAQIDLEVLKSAGPLAMTIMIVRMIGKYFGTWAGATISHAASSVRNYLGLGLSPQAGWTVGLVLISEKIFPIPMVGKVLVNAVVGSVIISQLICLPLVRYSLMKAGETLEQRRAHEDRSGSE